MTSKIYPESSLFYEKIIFAIELTIVCVEGKTFDKRERTEDTEELLMVQIIRGDGMGMVNRHNNTGPAFMAKSALKKYFMRFWDNVRSVQVNIKVKPVVPQREIDGIRQLLYNSGNETLSGISREGNLTEEEVAAYRDQLEICASKLGELTTEEFCSGEKLAGQINDMLMLVRGIAAESDKREKAKNSVGGILKKKIIPLPFQEGLVHITVADFFSLPLSFAEGETPFTQHLKYLRQQVAEGRLTTQKLQQIEEKIEQFPLCQYRKYFDLFKRGRFRLTALRAVYEVLETGRLEGLKIQE